MTAPTLLTLRGLVDALASPDGLPADCDDPRLAGMYAQGRIGLYGGVWRLNVRVPAQRLSPEQRAYIADDHRFNRSQDI